MLQKLAPDPFLIFLNNPKQPLHARNSILNKILKKDYQRAFKKLTFFWTQSLYRQSYQKQKVSETSDQSLFRLQNKFRNIPLYVIYYLTRFDDVVQFLSYSKNYIHKFMQINNSWHHKLFQFYLSFWIWKMWKRRGKVTKIWITQEWKKLFRWNKKHFP